MGQRIQTLQKYPYRKQTNKEVSVKTKAVQQILVGEGRFDFQGGYIIYL